MDSATKCQKIEFVISARQVIVKINAKKRPKPVEERSAHCDNLHSLIHVGFGMIISLTGMCRSFARIKCEVKKLAQNEGGENSKSEGEEQF